MTAPVIVDLFAGDLSGKPDIIQLARAGRPWCGVVLKATEGVRYPADPRWFNTYFLAAGEERRRVALRQGFFSRLLPLLPRVDQDAVKRRRTFIWGWSTWLAGGARGDLWPVVDVESADNPTTASKQQWTDGVTAYAERILSVHGRSPVLYAGSKIRDLGITDHLGCQLLWTAAYGSSLPPHLYQAMGWRLDKLFAWQFQGTEGFSGPAGSPRGAPIGSISPMDLSAVTIQNGDTIDEQLSWISSHLWAEAPA